MANETLSLEKLQVEVSGKSNQKEKFSERQHLENSNVYRKAQG